MRTASRNSAMPTHIGTWSSPICTDAGVLRAITSPSAGSIAWTANLAVYVPFQLRWPFPVRRVWWINGSTVTGNVDVGIHTWDLTRLLSCGSTVQSGASTLQYATPTLATSLASEVTLLPGRYYFGIACSGTTAALQGTTTWTASNLRLIGCLEQATALPLPANLTPVAISHALFPYCGMTTTSSGF